MRMFCCSSSIVVMAVGAAACGDDDTGSGTDTVKADAADAADTGLPNPETVSTNCPFTGTWNLQNVLCGDDDITADWFRVIDRTTAILNATPTGCEIVSTNETDACKEEERATLVPLPTPADSWRVTNAGITKCTPAACTFGGQDAACAMGDRAGTYDATIAIEDGRLRFTSTVGICSSFGGQNQATTLLMERR